MLLTLRAWPRRGRNCTASRTEPQPELTDKQWFLIADLFDNPDPSPDGGRPRIEPRPCLQAVIWVLRTGARWKDLPKHFPSPSTCWRRHRDWTAAGLLATAWRRLLMKLDRRGRLHWNESFADGTFVPAKKGAQRSASPSAARARRS